MPSSKQPPMLHRPLIPNILIEATIKAIKDGMKVDEFARAVIKQETERMKDDVASLKVSDTSSRATVRDEDRTYRNLDERRMGLMITENVHTDKVYGFEKYTYPAEPPLDYSFCMINRIEEIVSEGEQPQNTRNFRFPKKTADERYLTSSVRLSYNVIDTIEGLVNMLFKVLDGGPLGLCWLDLSFNTITKLAYDTLSQLPNLKILYLHANSIVDMTEILNLKILPSLITLTLHGNPLENEEGYRISVIYYLPKLLHLDFIGVTKSDRANSREFAQYYEKYWEKRHWELEEIYLAKKKAAEVSYTQRVMQGSDSDDDLEEVSVATAKATTEEDAESDDDDDDSSEGNEQDDEDGEEEDEEVEDGDFFDGDDDNMGPDDSTINNYNDVD